MSFRASLLKYNCAHLVLLSTFVLGSCTNPTSSSDLTTNSVTAAGSPSPIHTDTFTATIPPASTELPTPEIEPTAFPESPLILRESGLLPPSAVSRIPVMPLPSNIPTMNGRYYVATDGHGIRVIDTETSMIAWEREFGVPIHPRISPDGQWVVDTLNSSIYVWEIATGVLHAVFPDAKPGGEFLDWSPDGNMVIELYGESLETAKLVLWNPKTKTLLYEISDQKINPEDGYISTLWSKDGRLLITSNYAHAQVDNEIVVRDAITGKRLREMTQGSDRYSAVSIANLHFSPDQTLLAATYGYAGGDVEFIPGLTVLWDVNVGKELFEFQAEGMQDNAFSPDGTRLAYAGSNGQTPESLRVPIWSTTTGERLFELIPPYKSTQSYMYLDDLQWSPNGKVIATVINSRVDLWDGLTGAYIHSLDGETSSVTWSADGRSLTGRDREWNLVSGEITMLPVRSPKPGTGSVTNLTWFPDSARMAVSGYGNAQVWLFPDGDVTKVALTNQLIIDTPNIHAIAVSPDGFTLATAWGYPNVEGGVDLWNAQNGNQIGSLTSDNSAYYDVAWSPDGKWISTSGSAISIWSALTLEKSAEFNTGVENFGLDWSLDNRRLATASNGHVNVWDVNTGQQIAAFDTLPSPDPSTTGRNYEIANVVSWSPDGQYLAAGLGAGSYSTNCIMIWNMSTLELLETLCEHPQGVTGLAWSPDGSLLVASGGYAPIAETWMYFAPRDFLGSLVVWDIKTGKPIRILYGHTAAVQTVAFSPDGNLLASGSADGSVLIWDFDQIMK